MSETQQTTKPATDLASHSEAELAGRIAEAYRTLRTLHLQRTSGQLRAPHRLVALRRELARLRTEQRTRSVHTTKESLR